MSNYFDATGLVSIFVVVFMCVYIGKSYITSSAAPVLNPSWAIVFYLVGSIVYFNAPRRRSYSTALVYSCVFSLYSISCVSICVEFVEYVHMLNITEAIDVASRGYLPSLNVFPINSANDSYTRPVYIALSGVGANEIVLFGKPPVQTGIKLGLVGIVWMLFLPVTTWWQSFIYTVSIFNVYFWVFYFQKSHSFRMCVVDAVGRVYTALDSFHYGTLDVGVEDLQGAITLPRRSRQWNEVEVRDKNRRRNAGIWRFVKRRGYGDLKRLAGFTRVGTTYLPYPVACDPATLLRFRDSVCDDLVKWKMFVTGEFDFTVVNPAPLFHLYDASDYGGSPVMSWTTSAISQLFLFLFFNLNSFSLVNIGGHVTYVVVEEIFNEVNRFPIWFVEAIQAYGTAGISGVAIKTFVHGLLHLIPFPLRVVIHALWNNALQVIADESFEHFDDGARVALGSITDEQASMILGGSQAAKVALMLVKREWSLLAIEILQYVVAHRDFFGSWDVGALGGALEIVFRECATREPSSTPPSTGPTLFGFDLSEESTVVMLGALGDDPKMSKLSLLFSWLPSSVSRSPAVASSIALLTAYGLSLDPRELSWAGRLLRDVVYPSADVDNAHGLMKHAATVVSSLYTALSSCGTPVERLQAFLGVSKPVKFLRESTALQTALPISIAECTEWLDRADAFIRDWNGESSRLPPGMEGAYSAVIKKYSEVRRTKIEAHVSGLLLQWLNATPETSAQVRKQLLIGKEIKQFVKKELDDQLPFRLVSMYDKFTTDYKNLKSATGPIARPEPMCIMMMGEPGVGKTFGLQSMLVACVPQCNRVLEHFGLPLTNCEDAPRSVTNVSLEKKHMLSGNVFGGNLCILANDIPSNTTASEKSDKTDLAVHLQQCIDTAPLTMTAPEIAQKRVAHVPLLLYNTSNNMEFVCAGETAKLTRRMDKSVMLYCCYGDPSRPIPVEKLSGKTDAEKRELMRFTVCEFHAEGKRFWFTKTSKTFGYSHLTAYVVSKFTAHVDELIRKSELYGENVARCGCGKTYHDHFFKGDGKAEEFRTVEGLCTMTLDVGISPGAVGVVDHFGRQVGGATSTAQGLIFGPVDFVSHAFAWLLTFVLVTAIVERGRIGAAMEKFAADNSTALALKLMRFGERYPLAMAALLSPAPESNRLVIKAYLAAYGRFEALKDRLRSAILPLLAVGATAVLMSTVYRSSAPVEEKKKPLEELAVRHVVKSDRLESVARLETTSPENNRDMLRDYEGLVSSVKKAGWRSPEWTSSLPTFKTYGGSADDVISLAKKTTLPAVFSWSGMKGDGLPVLLVWVCPTWLGFNKHFIREVPTGVDVKIRHAGGHDGSTPFVATFRREDCVTYDGSEFFFVNILPATFPPSRSQLKFWCLRPGDQAVAIVYPFEATGVITRKALIAGGPEYLTVAFRGTLDKGTCGTPVVVRQEAGEHKGSHFIIGHVFAREDRAWGSIVYASVACQEEFERISGGIAPKGVLYDMTVLPVDPLPMVSQMNGIHPETTVVALGSEGKNDSTFKSSIRATVALPFVIKHFDEEMDVPTAAHVKGVMVDGVFKSPVTHATAASGHLPCDARPSEWKGAVEHLVRPVVQKYREDRGDKDLRPLTLTEALVGLDGFVDKVDMKKSVGPFFRSMGVATRFDVFDEVSPEEEIDEDVVDKATMKLTAIGEERCAAILETIDAEELFSAVNEWKYKDEVRPTSKLKDGKVRLFCVNDFAFGLLARAYLLPILAIWLKYPEISECYGAMNAGGPEAERLYQRLARQPNSFDGDFKVFDGSHASMAFLSVTEGVYKLAKGMGYTEKEAKRAAYFILSAVYSVLKFGRDYVLKAFGFPSGHIATLFFNSFVNSVLMRMVFARTVGDLKFFHEHVVTANVGDDNASSVSDQIADRFNMLSFIDEVAKLGYAATPAKKGDALVRFISRDEVVFLKRSWVEHPLTGCHVLALAKTSIWKAFGWHSTQSAISAREKIMQVSRGAQIEAWLHGPNYFSEFQAELVSLFDKIGYPPPILYSSDELLERWKLNELRSWAM